MNEGQGNEETTRKRSQAVRKGSQAKKKFGILDGSQTLIGTNLSTNEGKYCS